MLKIVNDTYMEVCEQLSKKDKLLLIRQTGFGKHTYFRI